MRLRKGEREKIREDIHLTMEFTRHVMRHPELLDRIPDGAAIEFVEPGEPLPPRRKNIPDDAPVLYIRTARTFEIVEGEAVSAS